MARFWLLGLAAIVGSFTQALPEGNCHAKCRCLPSQPCWPSTAEWKALNQSVHGQLVQVIPVGNVCHEPTFDEARCNELRSGLTYDARFRSAEPGILLSARSYFNKHRSNAVGLQVPVRG